MKAALCQVTQLAEGCHSPVPTRLQGAITASLAGRHMIDDDSHSTLTHASGETERARQQWTETCIRKEIQSPSTCIVHAPGPGLVAK